MIKRRKPLKSQEIAFDKAEDCSNGDQSQILDGIEEASRT